ncbi:MAG: hypothetical protein ACU0FH_20415 [Heliomarina sp.]|uniref:hypothetical protein n=1 Tax=Heliomarina sp. TaxID=2917556 RepID=UPI004058639E
MRELRYPPEPVTPALAGMSTADYVRLLHPMDSYGKVTIGRIDAREKAEFRTYQPSTAPFSAEVMLDESAYITLNRFNGPRSSKKVAELNALYLDLDVWRLQDNGISYPSGWAQKLATRLEQADLPQPSLLLATGRGLAAIWLIRPLPKAALARWSSAMKTLIQLFTGLGADSACSDCPRIFRLPGTVNLKARRVVEIIGGTGQRYDFEGFADRIYIAAGKPTRAELEARIKKASDRPAPPRNGGLSPRQRFALIEQDLLRLLEHWGGSVPEGHRNIWLHLMATCLTHTIPDGDLGTRVEEIARRATPGLPEGEIARLVRAAEARAQEASSSCPLLDGRLHYRGQTVATQLDISDDLARTLGLRQVYSDTERARRKAEKEKRRRQEVGAVTRKEYLDRNADSREKPWLAVGMSRATWYRKGKPRPVDAAGDEDSSDDEDDPSVRQVRVRYTGGTQAAGQGCELVSRPQAPIHPRRAQRPPRPASARRSRRSWWNMIEEGEAAAVTRCPPVGSRPGRR